jgi:hypothetical protein
MIRITDKQLEDLLADRRFNVPDPHEPWESCQDCQIRYALLELSAIRAKARRHLKIAARDGERVLEEPSDGLTSG